MVVRLVFISRTHIPRHVRIHIHIGRERREGGESEGSTVPSPRLGGPLSLEYVAWSPCRAFDALCPVRLPTHRVSIDRVSIRRGWFQCGRNHGFYYIQPRLRRKPHICKEIFGGGRVHLRLEGWQGRQQPEAPYGSL